MHGPGERPRQPESVESSKTYPGAIWLGPWIIAVNSPGHGTRRTGLMKVVVSVELPGFARGSCLRRDTGVIAWLQTAAAAFEIYLLRPSSYPRRETRRGLSVS